MSTKSTAKLDFVLRLIDQVTAPAAKVSKSLMDVAEVGKRGSCRWAPASPAWSAR